MDKQHKEAIRNLNLAFHEDLEPVKIARHLYQNKVIGYDDFEGVNNRLTREEQVDHLLKILPLKGPQAYRGFSDALYREQSFLGALLSQELENIKLGPSTDSVRNPSSLDMTKDYDSLKRIIKEYKEALKSTQRDHQAQKDTNHSLGIEIAQLKESVTQLTQQVRDIEGQLKVEKDSNCAKIQELEQHNVEMKQEHKKELENLNKKLEDEKYKNYSLEKELDRIEQEYQEFQENTERELQFEKENNSLLTQEYQEKMESKEKELQSEKDINNSMKAELEQQITYILKQVSDFANERVQDLFDGKIYNLMEEQQPEQEDSSSDNEEHEDGVDDSDEDNLILD